MKDLTWPQARDIAIAQGRAVRRDIWNYWILRRGFLWLRYDVNGTAESLQVVTRGDFGPGDFLGKDFTTDPWPGATFPPCTYVGPDTGLAPNTTGGMGTFTLAPGACGGGGTAGLAPGIVMDGSSGGATGDFLTLSLWPAVLTAPPTSGSAWGVQRLASQYGNPPVLTGSTTGVYWAGFTRAIVSSTAWGGGPIDIDHPLNVEVWFSKSVDLRTFAYDELQPKLVAGTFSGPVWKYSFVVPFDAAGGGGRSVPVYFGGSGGTLPLPQGSFSPFTGAIGTLYARAGLFDATGTRRIAEASAVFPIPAPPSVTPAPTPTPPTTHTPTPTPTPSHSPTPSSSPTPTPTGTPTPTPTPTPAPPGSFTIGLPFADSTSITVAGTSSSGADGIDLYWGTDGSTYPNFVATESAGGFSQNVSGLTPSSFYYFKAIAHNSAGTAEAYAAGYTTA